MSVSDLHGGGLTLQRVLGSDLDEIRRFVHVRRFAEEYPPTPRLQARSVYFIPWFENGRNRRYIGPVFRYLSKTGVARRWFARLVASRGFIELLRTDGQPLRALVCPQAIEAMQVLAFLRRNHDVTYVTWLMDDHLLRFDDGNWKYLPAARRVMEEHLNAAAKVLVISPAMQEFYEREFGVASSVLMPPADATTPLPAIALHDGPFRLGYFGRVWQWQAEALIMLAEHLNMLDATLDIYGNEGELPAQLQRNRVTNRGRVTEDEMRHAMVRCDALVLPTSFADTERHLVDFNIGTKMSEYLASGVVTLLIAPAHAAMARFLSPHNAAIIVSEPTAAGFRSALETLGSSERRRSILQAARRLVEQQLSTVQMRAVWREARTALEGSIPPPNT